MKHLKIILLLLGAGAMIATAQAKPLPSPKQKPVEEITEEKMLPPELESTEAGKMEMPEPPPLEKAETEIKTETKTAPVPPVEKKICHAEMFDRLMIGTRLYVRIFGHAEISREAQIGPKGTVMIPMVGEVQAEGETTEVLAKRIAEKLNEAYLIAQGVEVEVVQYPPIFVTGLVASPGMYDYQPRLTIRQAVALAGGFASRARTSEIRILRDKQGALPEKQELMGSEDTQLLPGDTIEILRRWF